MKINNKIAVITGAGSGIGQALAYQLAAVQTTVLITDFNEKTLKETYQTIIEKGGQAEMFVFDVSDRTKMFEFAEKVIQQYGQIDMVFNNAGVALGNSNIEDTTYEELEWIMGINLWGVIHGTKAFLPHLKTRPAAYIVNISSLFGITGIAQQSPYCMTKFAVRGFTESLRMELYKEDSKVKTLSVHPGGIKTNIVRNSRDKDEEKKKELIQQFDEKLTRTTAERAAKTILNAIKRNRERVMVGNDAKLLDLVVRFFPRFYSRIMVRGLKRLEN